MRLLGAVKGCWASIRHGAVGMKGPLTAVVVSVSFLTPVLILIGEVAPSFLHGGAAAFAVAADTLGAEPASGSPVLMLLGKALNVAVGMGNPAYRQNIAAILSLAAGFGVLSWLLARIGRNPLYGLIGLIFLFSPLVRALALTGGVLPFPFAYGALMFAAGVRVSKRRAAMFLAAFLCGAAPAVHPHLILFVPAVVMLSLKGRFSSLTRADLMRLVGFFVAGFAIHLAIPLRSAQNPILGWENRAAMDGVWFLWKSASPSFFSETILGRGAVRYSVFDAALGAFGPVLLAFVAVASVASFVQRTSRRITIAAWATLVLLAAALVGTNRLQTGAADGSVLLIGMLSFIPVALLVALGVFFLWRTRVGFYRLAVLAALLVMVGTAARNGRGASPSGAPIIAAAPVREDRSLRDFAVNVFRQVPRGAVLIVDRGDDFEWAAAYLRKAEGYRRDVRLVDTKGVVSPGIYGDDFYELPASEKRSRRERVESELVRAGTAPVFYASRNSPAVTPYRIRSGTLFRAVRLDRIKDRTETHRKRLLLWRDPSRNARIRGMRQREAEKMARSVFDGGDDEMALDLLGIAQLYGAPNRYAQLGRLYEARNRRGRALASYRQAMDRNDRSSAVFTSRGAVEMKTGRIRAAEETFLSGLRHHPDDAPLLYGLSAVYWARGDWSGVIPLLRRVLEIDPDFPEAAERYTKAKSLERFSERQREAREAATRRRRPPAPAVPGDAVPPKTMEKDSSAPSDPDVAAPDTVEEGPLEPADPKPGPADAAVTPVPDRGVAPPMSPGAGDGANAPHAENAAETPRADAEAPEDENDSGEPEETGQDAAP